MTRRAGRVQKGFKPIPEHIRWTKVVRRVPTKMQHLAQKGNSRRRIPSCNVHTLPSLEAGFNDGESADYCNQVHSYHLSRLRLCPPPATPTTTEIILAKVSRHIAQSSPLAGNSSPPVFARTALEPRLQSLAPRGRQGSRTRIPS